jgi:hypothetical protein
MRVGCIGYATEQGVGYLAKSFYDAGVITDMCIFLHDSRQNHLEWYPEGTLTVNTRPFCGPKVDAFVRRCDVMLCIETPFDWDFVNYCRERKVRTVLMPMYEWYPQRPPAQFDKFICPSLLDADYFRGSPFVPVPVDVPWQLRTKARRFLHNSGGIGFMEHKGTRELLLAMHHVKSPLTLTVRSQDPEIKRIMDATKSWDDPRITLNVCNMPYKELWDDHDVLIAPEKLNGLSLPLQEGRAAGMLVMTTDRYPMNTWLPREPLIPVQSTCRSRIAGHLQEIDVSVVSPEEIAFMMDLWYNSDISDFSLGGREWAAQNSWEVLKHRWIEALAS